MIVFLFGRKSLPYDKREDFIVGNYILIFLLLLLMFHESQTLGCMVIEKMYVIYFMYIDKIQSYSSNY
jgi:hypothetical protein